MPTRNEMVLSLEKTVCWLARRTAIQTGQPYDDLVSDGWLGAIEAVDRFDYEKMTDTEDWQKSLRTFASRRIAGAMVDAMRERDHLTRSQRAGTSRIYADPSHPASLDEIHFAESEEIGEIQVPDREAERAFNQVEDAVAMRQALSQLDEYYQDVLRMYYFEGVSLRQIGEHFSYTESRACQVLRQARDKMSEVILEGQLR